MSTATLAWSPLAKGAHPETTNAELDTALKDLVAAKERWVQTGIPDRVRLLERLLRDMQEVAPQLVEAACHAKGLSPQEPRGGEEWLAGPLCVHRNIRLLIRSLEDTRVHGAPRVPGPVTARADGQVVAQVFPDGTFDKILFSGLTAEVWMEKGVT